MRKDRTARSLVAASVAVVVIIFCAVVLAAIIGVAIVAMSPGPKAGRQSKRARAGHDELYHGRARVLIFVLLSTCCRCNGHDERLAACRDLCIRVIGRVKA